MARRSVAAQDRREWQEHIQRRIDHARLVAGRIFWGDVAVLGICVLVWHLV